jgi:hypothetical protein
MSQTTDRYDEIMQELTEAEVDEITDELDDAAPEEYIMAAAAKLGFAVPGVALDYEMPMATLMGFYAGTA